MHHTHFGVRMWWNVGATTSSLPLSTAWSRWQPLVSPCAGAAACGLRIHRWDAAHHPILWAHSLPDPAPDRPPYNVLIGSQLREARLRRAVDMWWLGAAHRWHFETRRFTGGAPPTTTPLRRLLPGTEIKIDTVGISLLGYQPAFYRSV